MKHSHYFQKTYFIPSLLLIIVGIGITICGCNKEEIQLDNNRDIYNGKIIYAGKDDLGRTLGLPGDNSIPSYNSDKYVGIFYFINHGGKTTAGPYDISKILAEDPEAYRSDERWISAGGGAVGKIHWWAESLFGYYRGYDKWVKHRDVQMLTDAGVDFLILDTSNAALYEETVFVLLDVLDYYSKQGFDVPQVAFVTKKDQAKTMMEIYDIFYLKYPEYAHLWFRLNGKPLILGSISSDLLTDDFKEFFTIKFAQWPREPINDEHGFPWISFERPQHLFGTTTGTSIISVSVAQHTGSLAFSTGAFYGDESVKSRSYHDGKEDKTEDAYLYGYNFAEQFEYAISVDPDIIFVTGWNEWMAYRLDEWHDVNNVAYSDVAIFVDLASANYSRDIQPMKGGFGDNYYMQMIHYIRKFKGAGIVNSRLNSSKVKLSTIDINNGFSQWNDRGMTYIDYTGDTIQRNERGFGTTTYVNNTGRNDFAVMKVSSDHEKIYFYAETAEDITDPSGEHWMTLFISTNNHKAKWCGYDFVLNRVAPTDAYAVLESCAGGWQWRESAQIPYKVEGNKIMLEIPIKALGYSDSKNINFQFKWADNYQGEGDIWSFYLDGDSAPYGRLNYLYSN